MSGRDQLAAVRPQGELLVMAMLVYPAEIRAIGQIDLPERHKVDTRKTKLAENLIRSWSHERFRFASYENHYREHLAELIGEKVAGREVVSPAETEEAPVINLMDALKKSLARGATKPKQAAAPPRAHKAAGKTKSKRKAAS
jgi:DNA end-binding protein Ku